MVSFSKTDRRRDEAALVRLIRLAQMVKLLTCIVICGLFNGTTGCINYA
jgi:hypothetical protein